MTGEDLKKSLRIMGVKQTEVAEILGITRQSVTSLLGAASVKTSTLEKIAKGIGRDISVFFSEEERKKTEELESLRKKLKEKDETIQRLREQVDRLLNIVERLQEKL